MEVELYVDKRGNCPFIDFLNSLNPKFKAKTLRTIEMLENCGHDLREPHSKALGDGLFELRTKFSTDINRSIYFFFEGDKAVITNGFIKKTNKTPKNEIDLAKRYRKEYLERNRYYE